MFKIFGTLAQQIKTIPLSKEDLGFRLVPQFTLEVIRKYLRIESEGIENIPKEGPVIIVSNHSGYAGFDAIMLQNEIKRQNNRVARLVAHKLWFFGEHVRVVSKKMGLVEADMNECLRILNRGDPLILFPEGEAGNFKPSTRRYRLQEFKRGFVRLAMITGAPIVPAYVIGAEETHINLSQIRFFKFLLGTVIPVPLNVIPLPVKWKISFGKPISLAKYSPADAMNRKKVFEITQKIRRDLQRSMINELRRRKTTSLPNINFNDDDVPGL
jgi:1-acyl-sn-glycerol-3-phosphate acyltransferase